MDQISKLLKFVIGWPLSLIALFFIIRTITPHIQTITQHLIQIQPAFIMLALLCFITFYFLRSLAWKYILHEKGTNLPLSETAYLWGISEIRRYIPGNIWTVVGRTVTFQKKGLEKKAVALAMLYETTYVVLGSALVAILSIPFLLRFVFPHDGRIVVLSRLSIILYVIGVTVYIMQKHVLKSKALQRFSAVPHLFPQTNPQQILKILAIEAVSYLLYGLGYFFACSAVLFLHPQDIFSLSGFFVLSVLIGFLSFLTPAGLGVREGIITIGLSRLVPLGLSGFASLFARLVLISSELLFLAIAFLWYKTESRFIKKIELYLTHHLHGVLLTTGILLYSVYFTIASFLRYDNFYTGRFDLGNMAQTVWNTMHGRIFEFTNPNGTEILSRLAFHADFLLILLAPLYRIWPNPKMLLLLQAVIVACGAIFVYLLAKKILKNQTIALCFGLIYLLNPSIERTTLYDFHAVTIATTCFLAAFYFLLEKRYWPFVAFAVLAALTKEQVWIILSLFGLYLLAIRRKWILGSIFTLLPMLIFYYLVAKAIPHALGGNHFALSFYSDFGDKPESVIKNIFFSPGKVFSLLLEPSRIHYLEQLLFPLGFLPLFAPTYLIFAIPELMINLLSNNAQSHQIYYQYTATITPFLFIAAIYGFSFLTKWQKKISPTLLTVFLCIASVYTAHLYGPLPGSKEANLDMFVKQLPNKQNVENYLRSIPHKYSVAASNNLGSHLSDRQKIFTIPVGMERADIVAFLLNDPAAQPSLAAQKQMAKGLREDPRYRLLFEDGDFIVFKKRSLFYL